MNDNRKSKLSFRSRRLGLALTEMDTRNQYLVEYGYGFGMQVFKTADKAIEKIEPWMEGRIIKLRKDVKEYERVLRYLKRIKNEIKKGSRD